MFTMTCPTISTENLSFTEAELEYNQPMRETERSIPVRNDMTEGYKSSLRLFINALSSMTEEQEEDEDEEEVILTPKEECLVLFRRRN